MKKNTKIFALIFILPGLGLFSNSCKKEVDYTVPDDPVDTNSSADTLQLMAAFY